MEVRLVSRSHCHTPYAESADLHCSAIFLLRKVGIPSPHDLNLMYPISSQVAITHVVDSSQLLERGGGLIYPLVNIHTAVGDSSSSVHSTPWLGYGQVRVHIHVPT